MLECECVLLTAHKFCISLHNPIVRSRPPLVPHYWSIIGALVVPNNGPLSQQPSRPRTPKLIKLIALPG